MENFVIAITRTCGSGGTTVGKMLAEHFGIQLYGRELLRLASADSGINESLFVMADENMKKSLLFRVSKKVYADNVIPPEGDASEFISHDNLFNYQAKALKELAKKESYVVIGRAADFVLRDYPNTISVLLYGSPEFCLRHEVEKFGLEPEHARKHIKKMNRYRADYYHYYTGRDWLDPLGYDLCVNTGRYGFANTAALIQEYVARRVPA